MFVGDKELTDWFIAANESAQTELLEVNIVKRQSSQAEISFRSGETKPFALFFAGIDMTLAFKRETNRFAFICDQVNEELTSTKEQRSYFHKWYLILYFYILN